MSGVVDLVDHEQQTTFDIFVIDDSPGDLDLHRKALQKCTSLNAWITFFQDARVAIEHCRHTLPDLVMLDLNLGLLTGFDVLREIRSRRSLNATPVVIVSGSQHPRDIVQSYTLGANAYIFKTADLDETCAMIQRCVRFWSEMLQQWQNFKTTSVSPGSIKREALNAFRNEPRP